MSPRPDDLPPEAEVLDPVFGERVRVPERTFDKIARDHPELRTLSRRTLLAAIRDADAAASDTHDPGRHRFYAAGVVVDDPWLLMIVQYDRGVAELFNAFGVPRLPRGSVRLR